MKDRFHALGLLVLMLIGAGLEMIAVSLMFPLIDTIARPDASHAHGLGEILTHLLPKTSPSEFALVLLTVIVSFYIFKNLFFAALIFLQWRFGFFMQGKLSSTLFDCYLRLPYTFHLQRNSADLLRNLTHETDLIVWGLMFPTLTFLTETMIAIGLSLLLLYTHPFAAVVIIGIFSTAGIIYYLIFRNRLQRWMEMRMVHDGKRIRAIQEGLGGLKEIKVLGSTGYFLEQYRRHNYERGILVSKQEVVHGSNLLLLEVLGMTGLLVLAGTAVLQNKTLIMVLPLMGVFAAAAFRLIPATNRMIMNYQQLRASQPVINTLAQALIEADSASIKLGLDEAVNGCYEELKFKERITLENITFTYPGRSEPVISNINLTIQKGEIVGVIGPSGVGKTTLIDILLGIYPPQKGRVLVDGIDIQQHISEWHRKIGYIPQNFFMIDASIRENIALGTPPDQIDNALVHLALKDAQLEEVVEQLSHGIYTPVGELGRHLSGGQKQRISIARALYFQRDLLVFDEATASLDKGTESRILDLLSSLLKEKTIIIITHHRESLVHCSKIIDIEKLTKSKCISD